MENKDPQTSIMEQILDQANVHRAWDKVRANKGSAGMDAMPISQFPSFAQKNLPRILEDIRTGMYKPAPVKRVWIPKPNGQKRPLGIPTVLDRVIQQSIAQILNPIFDVDFSDNSYGFRYGKQAIQAVEKISENAQQGYTWAVDCDLKSYFDIVNHDILMFRIGLKIRDKMVLKLIGKYLRAGVWHEKGKTEKTTKGVPQGGPLSPLLANIMLDPLDQKIEQMGLPFVRYADDFLILCKSKAEAVSAMAEVSAYIERKLKLLINQDKSQIAKLKDCEFLGFQINAKSIKRSSKSAQRFKMKVKEILSRSRGISMRQYLLEIRQYCVGWFHYFKRGLIYKEVLDWDQWLRRRIRLCYWKQWKRPGKRRRMLIQLGIDKDTVKMATRSRKGYWRLSSNSIVQIALNNQWLQKQGLTSLAQLWIAYKYPKQA
jgi:RNA-directed DNA polymerase